MKNEHGVPVYDDVTSVFSVSFFALVHTVDKRAIDQSQSQKKVTDFLAVDGSQGVSSSISEFS